MFFFIALNNVLIVIVLATEHLIKKGYLFENLMECSVINELQLTEYFINIYHNEYTLLKSYNLLRWSSIFICIVLQIFITSFYKSDFLN